MSRFTSRVEVPHPVEEVFAWHERPGALDRLSPPWESTVVEQPPRSLAVGTRVVLRPRILGPVSLRWVAEHVAYDPPHLFRDVQRTGPFATWDHRHRFERIHDEASALTDEVTYEVPLGRLGEAAAGTMVRGRIERMFRYRHRQLLDDLAAHRRATDRGAGSMQVAITGASGLIGTALGAFLTTGGHEVLRLVRRPARAVHEVTWDPAAGTVDLDGLRGVDAVVHLAADPIQLRPLTAAKRRALLDSRVRGTGTIARALATLATDGKPRTLVSASGTNVYGNRGDEVLTEESTLGSGPFLTEVAKAWEAATAPAAAAGVRTVIVRTGIVIDPKATILQVLGNLAKVGGAAPLGSGRQWWPWLTLDDTVGVYHHALTTPELEGPLNATAPNPVTNREFTRTLTRVLHRPMIPITVPRALPRLVLGGLADDLLFTSMRVLPARAEKTGYAFRHPELETGLRHVLGR